jgi:hypothetical protein
MKFQSAEDGVLVVAKGIQEWFSFEEVSELFLQFDGGVVELEYLPKTVQKVVRTIPTMHDKLVTLEETPKDISPMTFLDEDEPDESEPEDPPGFIPMRNTPDRIGGCAKNVLGDRLKEEYRRYMALLKGNLNRLTRGPYLVGLGKEFKVHPKTVRTWFTILKKVEAGEDVGNRNCANILITVGNELYKEKHHGSVPKFRR